MTNNKAHTLLTQLTLKQMILPVGRACSENSLRFIQQCLEHSHRPIISTSFGPQSGVLLHMVTQLMPNIPVIWVDSGYNLPVTYRHAERLTKRLNLNLQVYTPTTSAGFWDANRGGIPTVDDERHEEFTNVFKLSPFKQALEDWKPDIWFSSIRKEQSNFRAGLSPVHRGPAQSVKLAPLFHWQLDDLIDYLDDHKITDERQYFDPIKAQLSRECGLHTL